MRDPLPEKKTNVHFLFSVFGKHLILWENEKNIAGLKKGDRLAINLYRTYFSPL